MAKCDTCGSWVTPRYKRVFSDDSGYLGCCQSCSRNSMSRRDEYVRPKYDRPGLYAYVPEGDDG